MNSSLGHLLRYVIVGMVAFAPHSLLAQRAYYTPKALIMPLHDQKNQLHISLGRGGGTDLNLSYAITNQLALFHTATVNYGTNRGVTILGSRYNIEKRDYVLKGGLGYFSKKDKPDSPVMEAYLGAGISKIHNFWYFVGNEEWGDITKARYWSIFGQFNAGKRVRNNEYALGLRLAYADYLDFSYHENDYNPYEYVVVNRFEGLRGLTVEPVASYSYLWRGFKLNAQAGFAVPAFVAYDRHTVVSPPDMEKHESSPEQLPVLAAFLGRLSVQYNMNFNKGK